VDDDYDDVEEENGGYVHDYQGHRHQQHDNDDMTMTTRSCSQQ
jgi:hypothetical protein